MSEQSGSAAHPATASAMVWGGWLLVLGCALLRAQAALVPFPYWDIDPTMADGSILGIGPTGSVLLDVLIMLGAGLSLLGYARSTQFQHRAGLISTLLIAGGAVAVSLHAWVLPSGTVDDLRLSATWIAAMAAALGAIHICTHERLRRLTVAICIGFTMMLAAKGALEVFVEHPMTVERYRVDQEAFLAAQGWTPDSAAARNFERRLNQPEATGWFGMANVFASFAAAGVVVLLGLATVAWREARIKRTLPDGWAGILTFGALAAGGALLLAGGKGGLSAAALGVAVLGGGLLATTIISRRKDRSSERAVLRAGGVLAVGIVILALSAIVLRGLIGERLGELSLLFRWFYVQGASRIFLQEPMLGVGPAGFKDAYLLAKPPLSPEEVSSPHSIFFDWAATLGLGGLAWCAAWLLWIWMAGRTGAHGLLNVTSSRPAPTGTHSRGSFDTAEERADARIVLALAAGTMIISAALEQAGLTVESLLMRLIGAAAWIGVAVAALAVMRIASWWWVGMAGAIVLGAHAQIEVTPVWPGSAALFMIMIAAMAAPAAGPGVQIIRAGLARFAPAALILSLGILWPWLGLIPIASWQGDLRSGAEAVRPLAVVRERMSRIQAGINFDGDTEGRIAADVAQLVGAGPPRTRGEFIRNLDELLAQRTGAAQEHLESAVARSPRHVQTTEALIRLMRLRMTALVGLDQRDRARQLGRDAEQAALRLIEQNPTAGAYGLLGNILATRADFEQDPSLEDAAIDAWAHAAERDPHGLTFPWRIFRMLEQMGQAETSRGRHWAERVLRADEILRLDELKRLTPGERNRVRAALEIPRGNP